MAKLHFEKTHSVSTDEAVNRLKALLEKFAVDYPKLKIKTSYTSGGLRGTADGRGFDGKYQVEANRVTLDLKLGFIARPFQGRIEDGMRQQLADAFPESP